MNRINPLHVAILIVIVLLFFMFKLSGAKDDLAQTKELYKETLELSTELNSLNKAYQDKNRVRKSVNRLLKQSSVASANLIQNVGKSSIVLSSKSINKNALNSLMGKILNGSYNVYSFKIKNIDNKNASFKMEIKW